MLSLSLGRIFLSSLIVLFYLAAFAQNEMARETNESSNSSVFRTEADKRYFESPQVQCFSQDLLRHSSDTKDHMCYRYIKRAELRHNCGFMSHSHLYENQGYAANFKNIAEKSGMKNIMAGNSNYNTPEKAPPGSILLYVNDNDARCVSAHHGNSLACSHIEMKTEDKQGRIMYASYYSSKNSRLYHKPSHRKLVGVYVNGKLWDQSHLSVPSVRMAATGTENHE